MIDTNDYYVIRTKRKTIALCISGGKLEVRAPLTMPIEEIMAFIEKKSEWIQRKLGLSKDLAAKKAAFRLSYGDEILFMGRLFSINSKPGNTIGFTNKGFHVPPCLSDRQLKAACILIYKRLAKWVITKKVQKFAQQMNQYPDIVRISSAKTRWGSCSSRKSLNFSWRLIMAEDYVIDYVVVHELAHLQEMNHSPRFWQVVASTLPDFAERKKRLRELYTHLASENWDA